MIGNALFATIVIFLAAGFYLMQQCEFLIPFRRMIYQRHAGDIAVFAGLLFANLMAGFLLLSRRLFLKDTGDKLAHVEKQLRSGQSISEELTRRIAEKQ